ncbi:NIL domain-containing protein [Aetokthonos hydrillicola Thurmond2011]|uniref:NIL domain-containing protein n=1 Tax=Aetokthonos hydrillicola Thurmond2011 TaxID=2712845 RepID=A0AAP5I4I6_9CYAN|nr:NIL domain-containing protein [Aetokthonos hydrillicola]MBO3459027.1 ABC transporter [Aetokthonos hydrillicola CCALA 1050]MBW4590038.1 NIL domain-containing protein [Aetokthonos hydrillicola CCALA 1050]MDR9894908.1 NIL domain-containing protein [Aetokthonos hydrillicola Thurmond2011]
MISENKLTRKRIRLRIPKEYHQEPVISRLVSEYGLTVNISAAILGANGIGDGWFDLDLQGTSVQIDSAIAYLNDLDLQLWDESQDDIW